MKELEAILKINEIIKDLSVKETRRVFNFVENMMYEREEKERFKQFGSPCITPNPVSSQKVDA